ncbi:endopeptidase La [Gallalistipes aquisgranensis]|uniref:endopeptidase La n=1 Tax=Gallalistipes aquisgranensis TaxID=2779358 RepID=UPI001CF81CF9|nr:endopeptidase La [Gallalistipes aquisgranensis]MBE5032361.1 endopeptidase La [Gallalistipes aquisgranensis]
MSKKHKNEIEEFAGISDMLEGKHQVIPIVSTEDDEIATDVVIPDQLPILTLRSSVLFPGSITPITVGREKSMRLIREVENGAGILGAALQKEADIEQPGPDDIYKIGTAARILKILEMPNGNLTVILHGLEKIEITEFLSSDPYFTAKVNPLKDSAPERGNVEFDALVDSIRDVALNIINISPNMPKEASFAIKNIDSKRGIINFICSNIDLADADRQRLLEAPGLLARARRLLEILIREQQLVELKSEIQSKVKQNLDQQQREYFLQQQIRTIQDELGGDPVDNDIAELRRRAKKKKWSKEVAETFDKEVSKLERLNPAVAEYSVQMTYLQLMLDLPWNETTKDNLDLQRARKRLDADHFGLEEVKERILEHLAIIKLKGDLKSPIICLYGPPGVGKTSLGKSVAESLKRKFGRISLGGLHDEAEIRGHRRTYIGAMPGRIIQTIKRCGSSNPVIILDEVDKVGIGNHGDPSSALLEVLDPEQNTTFHDNYLDMEYDLSKVLFIATANNIANINPALRDRMEMINIPGYILEDKIEIARKHLLPKQLEAHGVPARELKIAPAVIEKIISEYTRESGVRTLDKLLAKIARHRAKNIGFGEEYDPQISAADVEKILGLPKFQNDMYEVGGITGVVTGLAWTEVGGDILYIESILTPGKGALNLTGNLGDVMKESATIALEWVKGHYEELGIDREKFEKFDINVHVPEGAIPKDGPSAGITMVTSLVSTYTGRKVKDRIAMTGETTLRGRVMPVGGIKEKILAAKRAGIEEIILSEDNRKDISEIKPEYIKGLTFHYVRTNSDVLELALQK